MLCYQIKKLDIRQLKELQLNIRLNFNTVLDVLEKHIWNVIIIFAKRGVIMWISKKKYQAMQDKIDAQAKTLEIYRKVNHKLEKDIRSLATTSLYCRSDIIFPNSDERGLGDSGTPINLSDILEL